MYTSSDNNDDRYYDNYISRALCGTGPVNQQDSTIQDAVNIGLSPKYKSEGHCWICPLGCLYVLFGYPKREMIHIKLLSFANRGTHPIYINVPFFELSPVKIHAIKSLDPSVMGDNMEEIIHILETLSMNHLPSEVKIFVKTCDSTAHQYYQRTLISASSSMQDFCGGHFLSILDFVNDYSSKEWEVWISRQQQPEPGQINNALDTQFFSYPSSLLSRDVYVTAGSGPTGLCWRQSDASKGL